MDRLIRHAAPLVLLGLAVLVWFERWIPGREWIAANIGEDAILRFVVGCVCVYAAVLIVERQQMGALFKKVLEQFKRFHESQGRLRSEDDEASRAEAIRILASAMASEDAEVRASAHKNLVRLCGKDVGEDPAAWRALADRDFPRS